MKIIIYDNANGEFKILARSGSLMIEADGLEVHGYLPGMDDVTLKKFNKYCNDKGYSAPALAGDILTEWINGK